MKEWKKHNLESLYIRKTAREMPLIAFSKKSNTTTFKRLKGEKNLLKKSVLTILFSVLLAFVASTSAFASEVEPITPAIEKALVEIEQTNAEIYSEIEKAQEQSYKLYDDYIVELEKAKNDEEASEITAKFDRKMKKLISDLDLKTQEMTRKGVEKASAAGVQVEIEWIPVQFADRVALIDPMKVVGW